ncbi:hypothetical protein E3U43_022823 [Larimichthys crocea]|uniref:Uncharacterized protein n=1 Tax=Larimichthys crocea TaxID=215358 RepID=A0ACD3R4Q8_LARCR|nr:hypothetical protein E3U43_022823 [Larimichthys crocea]
MKVYSLLLSIVLSCCSAESDSHDNPPADMTTVIPTEPNMDVANPMKLEMEDETLWKKEVLELLRELILVQREIAKGQVQMVQQLAVLETQGSQQILDLQNVARHQSLLVENHQALLLQTSRIATNMQEIAKNPAA